MSSPVKNDWVAGEQILAADINNIANHTSPTGTIVFWPTGSIPSQYLLCDGQAVSRTTYSALFAEIGTTYGVGDGVTTFNLPDFSTHVPHSKVLHVAVASTAVISNTTVETDLL